MDSKASETLETLDKKDPTSHDFNYVFTPHSSIFNTLSNSIAIKIKLFLDIADKSFIIKL